MKFCLSSRQEYSYLQKADEIKFYYRDRKAIPDFIEKYPLATLILVHSALDDEIKWQEIKNYSILARGNFIFCVDTIEDCRKAAEEEILFYHNVPAKTAYELNALIKLGVCYIAIDAPLFFDKKVLERVKVPLRVTPNLAVKDGLPRDNGIVGSWIRPEDLHMYEEYITTVEFEDFTLDREKYYQKERAMFRIYAEQHAWPGDIDMLITGLNFKALNRVIPPKFTEARLQCKQKCEETGNCHLCYSIFLTADREKIETYRERLNKD